MSEPLEPPGPELEALLEAERRRPDPDAAVERAVFTRLGATIWGIGGDPMRGPPGSTVAAGDVRPTDQDPTPGAAPVTVAGSGARLPGSLPWSVLRGLGILAVGAGLGAGIHAGFDQRAEERRSGDALPVPSAPSLTSPHAVVEPPPDGSIPAASAGAAPRAANALPVAPPRAPTERGHQAPSGDHPARDKELAVERALIEQAHTALSRGQGQAAFKVLERHAREFPRGELIEERESLMVQVLVGLDRFEQARALGARFHVRFPRSIFGAVVDESLRSIP
jgi:hypothetical protein